MIYPGHGPTSTIGMSDLGTISNNLNSNTTKEGILSMIDICD